MNTIINSKQTTITETYFFNGKGFSFNIDKGHTFSDEEFTNELKRYFIKSKGFKMIEAKKKEEPKQTVIQAPKVFNKSPSKFNKKFNKKEE